MLEDQEATARRFSHELHDELGQSLTAVKTNLTAMAGGRRCHGALPSGRGIPQSRGVERRSGRLTVDAHRGRIMEKLNLHSINDLVRFAVRNGLID